MVQVPVIAPFRKRDDLREQTTKDTDALICQGHLTSYTMPESFASDFIIVRQKK